MPRMTVLERSTLALVPLLAAALGACGSDGRRGSYPYQLDQTNVIGSREAGGSNKWDPNKGQGLVGVTPVGTYVTPDGDVCIELDGSCITPQKHAECGDDATYDVVVGADGQTLTVICYPDRDYEVVDLSGPAVRDPELGNNAVVVLDGDDDGVDIEGDLSLDGNNIILFGEGPDNSVIGGDLQIEKNNAIVRGVRIQGNLEITKNNASIVWCVVEGDLIISANNATIALCEVWGDVIVEGNNAVLVSNLIAGDQQVAGQNLRCNDNRRFTDTDGDMIVDEDDVLTPVTCDLVE